MTSRFQKRKTENFGTVQVLTPDPGLYFKAIWTFTDLPYNPQGGSYRYEECALVESPYFHPKNENELSSFLGNYTKSNGLRIRLKVLIRSSPSYDGKLYFKFNLETGSRYSIKESVTCNVTRLIYTLINIRNATGQITASIGQTRGKNEPFESWLEMSNSSCVQVSHVQVNQQRFPKFMSFEVSIGDGSLLPMSPVNSSQSSDDSHKKLKVENAAAACVMDGRYLTGKIFDQEKYSDLVLKSGSQEVKCHQVILSTVSTVFDRQLGKLISNKETDSSASNFRLTLDVSDVMEEKTTINFLSFIYRGELDNLSLDLYSKLFIAARHYAIKSLEEMCMKGIKSCLSVDNSIQAFEYAHNAGSECLKQNILSFIVEHKVQIMTTEGWKNMQPHIGKELSVSLLIQHLD